MEPARRLGLVWAAAGGTFLVTLPGPPAQITPLLPTAPAPHRPSSVPCRRPPFSIAECTSQSRYQQSRFILMHPPTQCGVCLDVTNARMHRIDAHNALRVTTPAEVADISPDQIIIASNNHRVICPFWLAGSFFIARRYRRPPWLRTRGTGVVPFFSPNLTQPSDHTQPNPSPLLAPKLTHHQ